MVTPADGGLAGQLACRWSVTCCMLATPGEAIGSACEQSALMANVASPTRLIWIRGMPAPHVNVDIDPILEAARCPRTFGLLTRRSGCSRRFAYALHRARARSMSSAERERPEKPALILSTSTHLGPPVPSLACSSQNAPLRALRTRPVRQPPRHHMRNHRPLGSG